MAVELLRVLLHNWNVLLCGDHLQNVSEKYVGTVGWISAYLDGIL
jgi:hypothetical protein